MTNHSLVGACLAPFYDASLFPSDQGFIPGRFCEAIDSLPGKPTCCLPCPASDWTYSQSFKTGYIAAGWLGVIGVVLLAFMLLSYMVLPATKTRSHYLSVCMILPIMALLMGFIIPLGSQPEQCYNEITPNDMYSSMECAWSGAFIIAGGLATVMWIFIRALSMYLQICWDIIPGKRFFYASQLFGWGVPAILFTLTITLTGVSFRLGNACHVNHENSMADFWGPLLALACGAGILQVATFVYCIHIYLKNLWSDQAQDSSSHSGTLPSHTGSSRARSARVVYQRLKKVLWLQWRGISIVTIIIVDVIYFSIIFVYLDGLQSSIGKDWNKVAPWVSCLVTHPDDRDICLPLVDAWLVNESTVVSVLILLTISGLQCFLLLTRPAIFPAWWELITNPRSRQPEFIPLERPDSNRDEQKVEMLPHSKESSLLGATAKGPSVSAIELKEAQILSPITSPSQSYRSPLQGRDSPSGFTNAEGYMPAHGHHRSMTPQQIGYDNRQIPASPPSFSQSNTGLQRPPVDYPNQGSRPPSDGQYRPSRSSFSTPRLPAQRHIPQKDSSDFVRNGLGLNPPDEVDEASSDGYGYPGRR